MCFDALSCVVIVHLAAKVQERSDLLRGHEYKGSTVYMSDSITGRQTRHGTIGNNPRMYFASNLKSLNVYSS
jgi:hypothetical protein